MNKETLCSGCGATVTMQGGRLRDSEANARCPNGYPWHTIAVSLPPVAIAPDPQHTPLETWSRNIKPARKYPIIFTGRNKHVAQVLSLGWTDEEVEAHCDLITAAPELLAALKVADDAIVNWYSKPVDLKAVLSQINAAISRAEGGKQ